VNVSQLQLRSEKFDDDDDDDDDISVILGTCSIVRNFSN
jgi:hypothetical protein